MNGYILRNECNGFASSCAYYTLWVFDYSEQTWKQKGECFSVGKVFWNVYKLTADHCGTPYMVVRHDSEGVTWDQYGDGYSGAASLDLWILAETWNVDGLADRLRAAHEHFGYSAYGSFHVALGRPEPAGAA